MRTKVFEGIETVDKDLWNQLVQGHPFASWAWCHFGEKAAGRPVHYPIVYEDDTPVGGAIITVMCAEDIPTANRIVARFLNWYLARRPLIVCRTASATKHKGIFLPDDLALRNRVLAEIRQSTRAVQRQYRGSFILADYLLESDLEDDWGEFFAINGFTNVGTRMTITWANWDEFMADLRARSKKQHKNVRHNIRYAQEAGITIQFSQTSPPQAEVLRLIQNKMDHYNVVGRPKRTLGVMNGLAVLPPQNYVWVTAHHEDRIVACELLLFDDDMKVCKPCLYGRDYSVKFVYFYLAYEDVRYAIEDLGARTLIYDTEAYEFKRRVGFEDDSRNHLVFYPGSVVERGLTRVLLRFMND
jgi:hypothetical protein